MDPTACRTLAWRGAGDSHGAYCHAGGQGRVRRDLVALRDLLGDKPFLFGDQPTGADYSVVPMLRAAIVTPVEKPLAQFIKTDPDLMAYVTRGTDRLYPTGV